MKPATELPWSVIDGQVFKPQADGCDPIVAIFGEPMDEMTNQDIRNARFAVHAANLYPELVKALEALMEASDDVLDFHSAVNRRARAAIAKAEGGQQ